MLTFTPIGYVTTGYTVPSDAPSQAAEDAGTVGRVVVHEEFASGLLGLEQYPFLWLLTWLHVQGDGPVDLQIVPRVMQATGRVQGVFASRAPRRPNPIALSLVRQIELAGNVVSFAGVDVVDGTPVLDIKPWFADCDLPWPDPAP